MAKYKFRLATLQKVRAVRRTQQRQALAEALRAEQVLAETRSTLATEEMELRDMQRSASQGKYLDVNRLLEAQRYQLLLKVRGEELNKQAILLAAETERRRQMLVEADRDVRVLERLDERQRDEHKRRTQRAEQKQLDEAATNRRRII
jgi:flagellar FliJ protein